jgi:hypothetical protein
MFMREQYTIMNVIGSIRNGTVEIKCNDCLNTFSRSRKHFQNTGKFNCQYCRYQKQYVPNLESRGWEYIEGNIQNQFSRVKCACHICKYESTKTINSFMTSGCFNCQYLKQLKYNERNIHDYIQSGHSLSEPYDGQGRLRLQCQDCTHKWDVGLYDYVSKRRRCPKCTGNIKISIEEIEGILESIGYTLLLYEYPHNSETKLKILCPKKHLLYTSFHNLKNYWYKYSTGCICNDSMTKSKFERSISNIFSNYEHMTNYRLERQEIDIYFPRHRFGIEFNGRYWHSCEANPRNRNKHYEKYSFFIGRGIRVFQIFESEWVITEKRKKIVDLIRDFLDNGPTTISHDTLYQDNTRPVYDTNGYAKVSESSPCIVPDDKYTVYDAGGTIYRREDSMSGP